MTHGDDKRAQISLPAARLIPVDPTAARFAGETPYLSNPSRSSGAKDELFIIIYPPN